MSNANVESFMEAARRVGAEVVECEDLPKAAAYIGQNAGGGTLVPETPLTKKSDFKKLLADAGCTLQEGSFRKAGYEPAAGATFCNFGMADTGTLVVDTTDESVRLTTTLPERLFLVADPASILDDNLAAAAPMGQLFSGTTPKFVDYITGPSRTADIERVLTIGAHGPRELHILLVNGVSADPMEN